MALFDFFRRKRSKPKRGGRSISIWRRRYPLKRLGMPLLALFTGFIAYICYGLPDISKLTDFKKAPSITVKAEDGLVLGTYGDVYGDYVPFSAMPKHLIQAVIATEDRNFYYHFGIDPLGLARAVYVNVRAHRVVQGGSTVTQQVAKNVFLSPARTFRRKLQEMILAFELEARFSKEEILTIYLNRVYMGAGNFGVDAASRRYFGHSVRDISLSESAILVGLLKAPSRYAPTSNPDLSEKRATQVLFNMVDAGYLTQAQADTARQHFQEEDATYRDSHGFGSFYFSDWVVSQLSEYIGEVQEDIVVTTTLRPEWQHQAEDAITNVMNEKGAGLKAKQAALVSMTPDGAIRAMVGGRNYRSSQFNRATQAMRQPGSSFKLFVYLAALEAGFTPDSEMEDRPISIGKWHPRNYTGEYGGVMTLRNALAQSINSIAIQLSEAIGRWKVVEMAQRLGITAELSPDPSIALGTHEVTLLDMTKAYAHLATGGNSVYPHAIEKIETTKGESLYQRQGSGGGEVLKNSTVNMMNNMLLAVTTYGTGRAASIGRPVAGKTGTTSDYRDAWFIGFVPQLVTGVWVGNDDTSPMKKVTGGNLPASIWHNYMISALKTAPVMSIPNSYDASDGGFLPWLTGGSTNDSPKAMQNAPAGAQPLNGEGAIQPTAPIHDEEPTPEYDAPSSFWENLVDKPEEESPRTPGPYRRH